VLCMQVGEGQAKHSALEMQFVLVFLSCTRTQRYLPFPVGPAVAPTSVTTTLQLARPAGPMASVAAVARDPPRWGINRSKAPSHLAASSTPRARPGAAVTGVAEVAEVVAVGAAELRQGEGAHGRGKQLTHERRQHTKAHEWGCNGKGTGRHETASVIQITMET
jgi:hypothetical protein